MIPDDPRDDPARGVLRALRTYEPGRDGTARIHARAHAALGRRRWRARRAPVAAVGRWRGTLEPAMVGVAAAAYLTEVVRLALRLYGW